MTTPSVDLNIVMPYGVTVEGDGQNRKAIPVTPSAHSIRGNVTLPTGPCRVAISWSGPESVRLTLALVGYPLTIPAGGGYRSGMVTIGAKQGDSVYIEAVVDKPLTKGARGTIEVYPVVSIE